MGMQLCDDMEICKSRWPLPQTG